MSGARSRCEASRSHPVPGTLVVMVFLATLLVGCVETPHERVDSIYDLKRNPTEDNLRAIREYLDDGDKNVRSTALFALASMPVEDADDLCLAALEDTDFFVRATAAHLLGELRTEKAVGQLVERLRQDGDWHVRYQAAESLGVLGGSEAVQALVEGLEDPMKDVRLSSIRGIAANDPGVAVDMLGRMVVEDAEWEVKVEAARALGLSGDASALPAVKVALRDSNEFVRSAAAHAFALLQGRDGKSN